MFAVQRRIFWSGLQSLLLHKLRSLLTILGVVFGVASVVSMLAIGEGISRNARDQLVRFGPDRIVVRSIQPVEQQGQGGDILVFGLTQADVDRLRTLVPGISTIAPTYELDKKEFWADDHRAEVRVVGTVSGFEDIHRLQLARGRFLTRSDQERTADVAVLGSEVAKELFPHGDPVGKTIKSLSGYLTIVGVMKSRIDQSSIQYDPNRAIYVPLATTKARFENIARIVEGGAKRFERLDLHQIGLRAESLERMPEIASMVRKLMTLAHPQHDFELVVPFELLAQMDRTKRVFNAVLGSIAGISLLVGGIGIMNIMLATVTERTREIGVRRALGATRRSITTQFLVESVTLSTIGGVLGIGLGLCVPLIVTRIAHVQTVVTTWSVILPLVISIGVGALFGVYPARRAANMEPIEALRHT